MNPKLRIAFVTVGVPSGGSTVFLLNLAEGLREIGASSEVFSFTQDNPLAREFSDLQVPVHTADESRSIFEDRLAALYQKLAAFRPNAAIANLGADSLEMLRYIPPGVARIAMIHEQGMQHGPPNYKEFVDGIAVVNPAWVNLASQRNPSAQCRFLAHGISIPKADLVRAPNFSGLLRLVYFGRLNETKGTRLFPPIAKHLEKLGVPFRWTIHGEGPEETWLRAQFADAIKAGTIVLAPHVPRKNLFRTIREHDAFIMASESEGGPLTLLEAMVVGLVPICGDIPCLIQEVINCDNGFVVPRDPGSLAHPIAELHRDRARLEKMSAAARKTITERYSLKAMAERYLDFIRQLGPKSDTVAWPEKIQPQPIRGLSFLGRISQNTAMGRQLRRTAKRIGR